MNVTATTHAKVAMGRSIVRSLYALSRSVRLFGLSHSRTRERLDEIFTKIQQLNLPSGLVIAVQDDRLTIDSVVLENGAAEQSFARFLRQINQSAFRIGSGLSMDTLEDVVSAMAFDRASARYLSFGLVFEPSKLLSLYATASKSFRPNSGVKSDFTSFPPEKGKSYEVGAKFATPDSKITSTIALYKITKNNVLTPDPADPNNFSVAAGEVESKGVEFDVSGEVMTGLRLSAAYAYTDAQVTKDNNAFLVGRQMANVPRDSANLLLVQSFQVDGHAATFGAGVNYIDKREGAVAPLVVTDNFKLPAYTTVKLITSFNVDKHLQLSLDVDNLFDKTFYTSSYSQVWVFPGSGRIFTGTAQYKF